MSDETKADAVMLNGAKLDMIQFAEGGNMRALAKGLIAARDGARDVRDAMSERDAAFDAVMELVDTVGAYAEGLRTEADTADAEKGVLFDDRKKAFDDACKLFGRPDDAFDNSKMVMPYVNGEKSLDEVVEFYSFGKQKYKPKISTRDAKAFKPFRFSPPEVCADEAARNPFILAVKRLADAEAVCSAARERMNKACAGLAALAKAVDDDRKAQRRTVADAIEKQRREDAEEIERLEAVRVSAEIAIASLSGAK